MTDHTGKRKRAKKKLGELKGYYGHLVAYIAVNTMIALVKIVKNINNGETLGEAFWDFGTFAIWFFWGIGLFFHTIKVFSYNPFFNKDWEKRQIQKYMDQEREKAENINR